MSKLMIGDKIRSYVRTLIGECVGCIELQVAQNLKGEKIVVVTDSHGGVGFIADGSTAHLTDSRDFHNHDTCMLEPHERRSESTCARCWMRGES